MAEYIKTTYKIKKSIILISFQDITRYQQQYINIIMKNNV